MKTCDDVRDLLPDVTPVLPDALEVHEHLRLCGACAEAAEEHALIWSALAESPSPAPVLGTEFADRVLAALPPAPATARPASGAGWGLRTAAAAALFAAGALSATLAARAGAPPDRPEPPAIVAEPAPRAGADQPPPGAPAERAPRRARPSFEAYLAEAGVVLEAVDQLSPRDRGRLDGLARHVDRSALVETGDRLLVALESSGEDRPLTALIAGTQLILRKVRRAPAAPPDAAITTLRREVTETGILDAYRQLFSGEPTAAAPRDPNDPL